MSFEKIKRPEKVIQFGEGGFLRGFVDWMIQKLNDAGEILDGTDVDEKFFDFCIEVANGMLAKNEINGYSEISIFKDGVTL